MGGLELDAVVPASLGPAIGAEVERNEGRGIIYNIKYIILYIIQYNILWYNMAVVPASLGPAVGAEVERDLI